MNVIEKDESDNILLDNEDLDSDGDVTETKLKRLPEIFDNLIDRDNMDDALVAENSARLL